MLKIGKYQIELCDEIASMNCRIFNIFEDGDFYDCILEIDGTFELVSNYHRESCVFEYLVPFVKLFTQTPHCPVRKIT